MIKIIALCMVALGIVIVHPGKSCAETAIHQAPNQAASVERRKEGPDGLTVLALLLAALVPTFVVSQLLLLLVGPHLVLAHGASFLITGFAAGTLFTSESGFAGTGALALVAAPQLFWLLVDLIRARSGAERN